MKQIYRYSQTGGQPFVAKKNLAMKFASGDSGAAHDSDQLELLSLNLTEWHELDDRSKSSSESENSLCNAGS